MHTNGALHFALPAARRDPETAAQAKASWETCMEILERRLERGWLIGSAFTLVDLANASGVAFGVHAGKLSVESYKNVAAWRQRCQSRPAHARAVTSE
jgi:glutathione S-transferase